MSEPLLRPDSLVLYKQNPARVVTLNDRKIDIQTESGETVSVRPKDVTLLHPGPLRSLRDLKPLKGEATAAWELLAGTTTTLPELAELAFNTYTPVTAWATYQLVADGLYFSGSPEEITAHTADKVATIQSVRAAKAAEERAWHAFLSRAQAGRYDPADERYLADVVTLALGQREQSRVLRLLNREETPQNAHSLLLTMGYWTAANNPYPTRLGAPTTQPETPLPPLADEPRRDLTHLPAFAIDDEGAHDPDDAVSWDGARLWVHVADVAALILPDSPADQEARARGANLYLPEGTVHMLPLAATEELALGLREISPALSFALTVSAAGEIADVEVVPSWVRVTRLSYEEAETQLDEAPFHDLHALAETFARRRREHEAIELHLPEAKLRVVDGQAVIKPIPRLRSRDLVREAMLMTGEAVAHYALKHNLAIPFTVQEAPEELLDLADDKLSAMFAQRRLLKPSQQKGAPGKHAGLGLSHYVQVTSPLRRYADLLTHQQLRAHLRGEAPFDSPTLLARLAEASVGAGLTRRTERLSNTHWTLVHLLQHPTWSGEGVVVEKAGTRTLVVIPELAFETDIYGRPDLLLDEELRLTLTEVNLPTLEARFRVMK
jgi:exoribonuclease-2